MTLKWSVIKEATPENIRKISWLYPNFADEEGNIFSWMRATGTARKGQTALSGGTCTRIFWKDCELLHVPTFPNANHLFVMEEYDYWKQKPEKEISRTRWQGG